MLSESLERNGLFSYHDDIEESLHAPTKSENEEGFVSIVSDTTENDTGYQQTEKSKEKTPMTERCRRTEALLGKKAASKKCMIAFNQFSVFNANARQSQEELRNNMCHEDNAPCWVF